MKVTISFIAICFCLVIGGMVWGIYDYSSGRGLAAKDVVFALTNSLGLNDKPTPPPPKAPATPPKPPEQTPTIALEKIIKEAEELSSRLKFKDAINKIDSGLAAQPGVPATRQLTELKQKYAAFDELLKDVRPDISTAPDSFRKDYQDEKSKLGANSSGYEYYKLAVDCYKKRLDKEALETLESAWAKDPRLLDTVRIAEAQNLSEGRPPDLFDKSVNELISAGEKNNDLTPMLSGLNDTKKIEEFISTAQLEKNNALEIRPRLSGAKEEGEERNSVDLTMTEFDPAIDDSAIEESNSGKIEDAADAKIDELQKREQVNAGVTSSDTKPAPKHGTNGQKFTKQEEKQYAQAIQDLNDVANIIDKYMEMQKESITASDKKEIKKASKKMDAALAAISKLSERTGAQLLEGTRDSENRKKLTMIMRELGIPR